MASLTLKNIPAKLLDQIRAIAENERRSMTQQVIYMLEQCLNDQHVHPARDARRTDEEHR